MDPPATPPLSKPPSAAPSAPVRKPPRPDVAGPGPDDPASAWLQQLASMRTMPEAGARRLKPEDVGVRFGPLMDEEQFRAYRAYQKAQREGAAKK